MAFWLRLSPTTLWTIALHRDAWYRVREESKRSGGIRTLRIPGWRLRTIQREILRELLSQVEPAVAATGFYPGASIKKNAARHVDSPCVLNLDLQDFFESIPARRVYFIFLDEGVGERAAWLLSRLCTVSAGLPQGAPTSPALSNLVARKLDRRLIGLAHGLGVEYTRYADDLTFSCDSKAVLSRIEHLIRVICEDEGFALNDRKRRLACHGAQRRVTGLILGNGRVGIGRTRYRQLRSLVRLQVLGELSTVQELSLAGTLAFVRDVDRTRLEMLARYATTVAESVDRDVPGWALETG